METRKQRVEQKKEKSIQGEGKHLVKTSSQEKHNGHNTKKINSVFNIYLSNEPLKIPLICASGEREKDLKDGATRAVYFFASR